MACYIEVDVFFDIQAINHDSPLENCCSLVYTNCTVQSLAVIQFERPKSAKEVLDLPPDLQALLGRCIACPQLPSCPFQVEGEMH